MSYYFHNVPGRLRVKTPVIKNNPKAEYNLKKELGTFYGIATVDINLITGSILINYNPKITNPKDILNFLHRKGYFDPSKAVSNEQYIKEAAAKAGTVIGRSLFSTFAGLALEKTPFSFLALLI